MTTKRPRRILGLVAVLLSCVGCERRLSPPPPVSAESRPEAPPDAARASIDARDAAIPTEHTVRFAWSPPGADPAAYQQSDAEDQHRLVFFGTTSSGRYPVLIALHGQPKRGQIPRNYAFPQKVIDVARDLVGRGERPPLAVALPVFRYVGVDWPAFDLALFRARVEEAMRDEGLTAGDFYVVGHSGAAGCGGDGLNRAHRIEPKAVGFFDTCLGSGWRDEIRALKRAHVRTLVVQGVETAGVQPRHLREYDGRFDFGRVFGPLGLAPTECPTRLPDAPLRPQPFHCSSDPDHDVQAFIIDTGEGEAAHNALVPIALAYFLREYVR